MTIRSQRHNEMIPGITKKEVTWVAVLDRHQAHFYKKKGIKGLEPIEYVLTAHPLLSHHEDKANAGRSFDNAGAMRHVMEPHTTEHEIELQQFVKEVADYLKTSHEQGLYHKLIIIAAPKSLGALRKLLHKSLRETVVKEIAKELVYHSPNDLKESLGMV